MLVVERELSECSQYIQNGFRSKHCPVIT